MIDHKLKNVLIKAIGALNDDEVDLLLDEMGIDKKLVLEDIADEHKTDERGAAYFNTIAAAEDNGDGTDKAIGDIVDSHVYSPEELNKHLHDDDAELYSGSEKDAVTDLASGMSLDDAADKARAGQIADAVNKTIIDSVKEGENRDFFKELQNSNSTNASQLHKHLHGDDAELYTDEEKTALGNIVNAIRDRWQ